MSSVSELVGNEFSIRVVRDPEGTPRKLLIGWGVIGSALGLLYLTWKALRG